MSEEFRNRLVSHAKLAIDRAGRALTEAATQQYLVLPFIQLLGYDPLDPDMVVPEAHASFSDKFKNRVDYAICMNKEPVIAVECKKVGTLSEANKGELKGYFNAVPSVKLGILTDGLIYQLFSDTNRENMMDDDPFAVIDLAEIAAERINENAFEALLKLRKDTFDPADVGADARRRIYISAYVAALESAFSHPPESIVKTLMDLAAIEGRRTPKLVEEHAPIVAEAIRTFFDKKLLERVGFADRRDLVRMTSTAPAAAQTVIEANGPTAEAPISTDTGIITTETELQIFNHVKQRLPFLIERDDALFRKLGDVGCRDYKSTFSVFYKQERKGRMFNFREGTSPKFVFEFPDIEESIKTDNLSEIDNPLLAVFMKRVQELG